MGEYVRMLNSAVANGEFVSDIPNSCINVVLAAEHVFSCDEFTMKEDIDGDEWVLQDEGTEQMGNRSPAAAVRSFFTMPYTNSMSPSNSLLTTFSPRKNDTRKVSAS